MSLEIIKRVEENASIVFKDFQRQAILSIANNDVFVNVPTGFGKSFCYAYLPYMYNLMGIPNAIVIVISPLIALMKDQVWLSCT